MPFPAVAVRLDPGMAVWRREQSSRRAMNLRDMPILLPEIPADQYRLPELVGRLFDVTVTVLSRDVLRPLADAWCSAIPAGYSLPRQFVSLNVQLLT